MAFSTQIGQSIHNNNNGEISHRIITFKKYIDVSKITK